MATGVPVVEPGCGGRWQPELSARLTSKANGKEDRKEESIPVQKSEAKMPV
jgi:hypothetical protein